MTPCGKICVYPHQWSDLGHQETTGQTRDGEDDDDDEDDEYVPESETDVRARISAFNRGIDAMDAELLRQQGAIESEIKRLHPAGTVERAEKLQQLETNIQKMKVN